MVGDEAIVPRCLCKIRPGHEAIICFTLLQAMKTGGGMKSRKRLQE